MNLPCWHNVRRAATLCAVSATRREYELSKRLGQNYEIASDATRVHDHVLWEQDMHRACLSHSLQLAEAVIAKGRALAAVDAAKRIYAQANVYDPPAPDSYARRLLLRYEMAVEWEAVSRYAWLIQNWNLDQAVKRRRRARKEIEVQQQKENAARHRQARRLRYEHEVFLNRG